MITTEHKCNKWPLLAYDIQVDEDLNVVDDQITRGDLEYGCGTGKGNVDEPLLWLIKCHDDTCSFREGNRECVTGRAVRGILWCEQAPAARLGRHRGLGRKGLCRGKMRKPQEQVSLCSGSRGQFVETHHCTFIAATRMLKPASLCANHPNDIRHVALAAITIISATLYKLWLL